MMRLHLDRDSFRVLINRVSEQTGYRTDVVEKDYYVTLILEELAGFQKEGLPAYFRGGTALYKALHSIRRFSEDIDLSVDVRGCSRTHGDKRMAKAAKRYASLPRNVQESKSNRSEVISIYGYEPVVAYDAEDALQRFGKVKVEATSFTISEPYEPMLVAPIVYETVEPDQKRVLTEHFDVKPFEISTMTMERIFIDKLFAAEAYTRYADKEGRAFEAAKHIYDLSVMIDEKRISAFFDNNALMKELLSIRMEEELNRLDGIPRARPKEFIFFDEACGNSQICNSYDIMLDQYVFIPDERIKISEVDDRMRYLKTKLVRCEAWNEAEAPSIGNANM